MDSCRHSSVESTPIRNMQFVTTVVWCRKNVVLSLFLTQKYKCDATNCTEETDVI